MDFVFWFKLTDPLHEWKGAEFGNGRIFKPRHGRVFGNRLKKVNVRIAQLVALGVVNRLCKLDEKKSIRGSFGDLRRCGGSGVCFILLVRRVDQFVAQTNVFSENGERKYRGN